MGSFDISNKHVATVDIDLTLACCLIAQIQLACRHRGNNGASREFAEGFARKLQQLVVEIAPENATILEMGWNPDFDI